MCFIKKKTKQIDTGEFYSYLGGKDNLINLEIKGSRISLELKDKTLLNKEKLISLGVNNFLEMSNKILLVCSDINSIKKCL